MYKIYIIIVVYVHVQDLHYYCRVRTCTRFT